MTTVKPGLLEEARSELRGVVELRRRLYRLPELGLELPRTQAAVAEALAGLPLEVELGCSSSSVTATLRGALPGRCVLLRADMDALPIQEGTELEFASTIGGVMHACGHDAHTAMLVGAARILSARRGELAGSIRFMFQPGEEGHRGAQLMIEEGVLAGVDAAFALHVAPNLPAGWISTRPGAVMASADEVTIVVRGRGGHASTPHFSADPVPVACEIVSAIQTAITRRVDVFNPAVVTISMIEAGAAPNVISDSACMTGTIRAVSERTRASVHADLAHLAEGIAAAHRMEAEVVIRAGYPVTVNDPEVAKLVLSVAEGVVDGGRVTEAPAPTMGAEDWSYVLRKVPGAMAFLGVCPPDVDDARLAPACHSNLMRMDEGAMAVGVALHVAMAEALAGSGAGQSLSGSPGAPTR